MKNVDKILDRSDRKFDKILGINVLSTSRIKVLANVRDFIAHNRKFYIVTPNPELILMAQDNLELSKSLNGSALPIPDGFGLKFADPSIKIIKGRQLFLDLVSLANKKGWKVFFAGGERDEAFAAKRKLMLTFKKIKIESFPGPRLNDKAEPISEVDRLIHFDMIQRINRFRPHLLFLAFKNPRQEIWLHKNFTRVKAIGGMATGGTFRYIAGYSKLPPKWMARIGLEWLWRFINEPYRLARVWRAVVIFPLALLKSRLGQSHV